MSTDTKESKRIYRSKTNRAIAGVCGGIGEYYNIDPVLVRILFIVAIFGLGLSILVYPILWLVIPEKQ